jgi:hypothetical protein
MGMYGSSLLIYPSLSQKKHTSISVDSLYTTYRPRLPSLSLLQFSAEEIRRLCKLMPLITLPMHMVG